VTALAEMNPAPTSIALGVDLSATGTGSLFQDNVLVTSP